MHSDLMPSCGACCPAYYCFNLSLAPLKSPAGAGQQDKPQAGPGCRAQSSSPARAASTGHAPNASSDNDSPREDSDVAAATSAPRLVVGLLQRAHVRGHRARKRGHAGALDAVAAFQHRHHAAPAATVGHLRCGAGARRRQPGYCAHRRGVWGAYFACGAHHAQHADQMKYAQTTGSACGWPTSSHATPACMSRLCKSHAALCLCRQDMQPDGQAQAAPR